MKEKTENLHEQFRNTSQSLQRKMAAVDENHNTYLSMMKTFSTLVRKCRPTENKRCDWSAHTT